MLYQSTIHKDIKTCMKKRSRKQKLSITFDCTKSEIEHVILMKNLIYYRAIADIVRTKEPRIPPTDLKSGYMKLSGMVNVGFYLKLVYIKIQNKNLPPSIN
jgi:hypothetical protein